MGFVSHWLSNANKKTHFVAFIVDENNDLNERRGI